MPLPSSDDTLSVQSISYIAMPSREHSLCYLLLSLFSLMLLPVTRCLSAEPSPTIEAATPEEYNPGDAAPPGGYHTSYTPFTLSPLGGWYEP
jgi:hypothetical protein